MLEEGQRTSTAGRQAGRYILGSWALVLTPLKHSNKYIFKKTIDRLLLAKELVYDTRASSDVNRPSAEEGGEFS